MSPKFRRFFSWLGRIIATDVFAAFAMCGILVFAQYHVNLASRWTTECENRKYELLTMKLGMLEATLRHNEGLLLGLRTQLTAHDSGQRWELTDTKQLDESLTNLDVAYANVLAGEPKRQESCENLDDFKDQSIIFYTLVAAALTFFGFQFGKRKPARARASKHK